MLRGRDTETPEQVRDPGMDIDASMPVKLLSQMGRARLDEIVYQIIERMRLAAAAKEMQLKADLDTDGQVAQENNNEELKVRCQTLDQLLCAYYGRQPREYRDQHQFDQDELLSCRERRVRLEKMLDRLSSVAKRWINLNGKAQMR
eukprot:jgi/Hompol1/1590/HPOL_005651-RA